MVFVIAFAGLTPGAKPYCGEGGCFWNAQPIVLLDSDERIAIEASSATRRNFQGYAARPLVRLGLAGVKAIESVPFGLLLVSVGLALRRFGGRGPGALAEALPWLRRASLAAFAWTLASPVYETLLVLVLSPGTPAGARLQPTIVLFNLVPGLLLATAAYATVWALEAGIRAERDLADFV